jgi:pSer/pThr/pTyr-binding forkhead associated (FHA) protein
MGSTGSEQPMIIGQTGPLNGKKWIVSGELKIGRDEICEVIIPDRQVSRVHGRLKVEDQAIQYEDLESKNGSFINGNQVTKPVILHDGDIIQVALAQYFVFLNSDSTMPAESSRQPHEKKDKGLVVDKLSRRVWVNGEEVIPPLSAPQFRLLETLYNHVDEVVSRQDLILAIWRDEEAIGISEQALDAMVRRLRDRLQPMDPEHQYLITIRGHGLRLENRED